LQISLAIVSNFKIFTSLHILCVNLTT